MLPKALPKEKVDTLCLPGMGELTCSFLALGPNGLMCAKGTIIENRIVFRRNEGSMRAKGDNCSGPPDFTPNDIGGKPDP